MKIKKINEDKVQIIITNQDLEERDFKKWELMPLSPKAQELFQDLLDMAYQECGFEIEDDSQLMVEAYPLTLDSFVVVMTKVRSGHFTEQFHVSLPLYQEEGEEIPAAPRGENQVWSFSDLEACSLVCSRLTPDYLEKSALYKYLDTYYLAIQVVPEAHIEVGALLGEYGDWVPVDEVFLLEYGVTLIEREAIVNLASTIR